MADVQDVLNTVAAQIAGFVYPSGTAQPSVTGKAIKVFPGWPMPNQIDIDMPQGVADVSVYATPTERNTTRYRPKQKVMAIATATISLSAGVGTLTVGGSMPSPFTPHNVAAIVGGQAFVYPVQASDTLTSVATGLANLIAAEYPGTTNSGPVITLPRGVSASAARVGTTGTVTTEWERQSQIFQITVWAPDPSTRATIGAAIKSALSQIAFITMPDGYGARIRYQRNVLSDAAEKVHVYRRDLYYDIEYATTSTKQIATVVATEVELETQDGAPILTRTY
ncbi:hypothetical protein F4827_003085 [Paraburkholderia bannensis]|uniref:Uncharacterized protein n=1 Tax=Paraburkholderia bannensis TaxID=765414 RepID=A0A7W9WRI2_9BURK|nr:MULTISPECIES: hypothetical protein [Paraburkholderia]MBB3258217.1 hypothetical protein [Paraburkholderia sp. WP4_3_2]MBB6103230.1 hypothetical protein [Paraburkholderia bannensis]